MNTLKYFAGSFASGAVWAVIAFLLGSSWIPERELQRAMIASPLIGLTIGLIYLPAYRWPVWARVLSALFTLELSAVLFAMAMGDADSVEFSRGLYGVLWGLNVTGYVIILWPIAFLNHHLLGKLLKTPAKRSEAVP